MSEAVIIIESPNKIKKVKSYSGFDVFATVGHFMDLVGFDENFKPKFEYSLDKKKNIFSYIEKCKNKRVYIATDPDREGYAIGKMFFEKIKNVAKEVYRAEFHEITEGGIKKGLNEARLFNNTNFAYYDSFLGRRVGDRLIGFSLSPYLMKQLNLKGASAGRVQTPALGIIVDREKEILEYEKMPKEERLSYVIEALALNDDHSEFILKSELKFNKESEAQECLNSLKDLNKALVMGVERREVKKAPPKPFITSKLLKVASKALKASTSDIQIGAQRLFEAGLITYIRTDAETLSQDFLKEAEEFFSPIYKDFYLKRIYEAKNSQAEAHEAIRITHTHKFEDIDEILVQADIKNDFDKELYKLIFKNTVSSQLKDAIFEKTTLDTKIANFSFKATASKVIYKGFMGVFDSNEAEEQEENSLSLNFKNGDFIAIKEFRIKEIEKSKPKRYLESDFIEVLEKKGIGRPSTYATYTPILQNRDFISIDGKNREIRPTPKGISVIDFFKNDANCWILDLDFTKKMEEELDRIANKESSYCAFMDELKNKIQNIDLDNLFNSSSKKEVKKTPPSPKQIQFCEDISKKLNIKLPSGYKDDFGVAKRFIDANIKKLNSNK